MKVLLVYELIPEETFFYVFENVNPDSELYVNLLGANGHYANFEGPFGDNASTEFLVGYLEHQAKLLVENLPHAGPFDTVFHSGFGL